MNTRTVTARGGRPSLSIFILALFLLTGCETEKVRLAFVGDLTGKASDLGIAGRDGATYAVEVANEKGGVQGKQIKLEIFDDHQEPESAAALFNEITQSRSQAIIGPMTSSMAFAMLPLANEKNLLLISPTANASQFNGVDDRLIRITGDSGEFARRSARHHMQRYGWRNFVTLTESSNWPYTRGWSQAFASEVTNIGGAITQGLAFNLNEANDIRSITEKLLSKPHDAILIIANSGATAQFLQAIKKKEPKANILIAEWAATEQLIELGGKAAEGVHTLQPGNPYTHRESWYDFETGFQARFGRKPGYVEMLAFDATNVTLMGLAERANEKQDLKTVIIAKHLFRGVQQSLLMDRNGDVDRESHFTVIQNSSFVSAEP